jgi:hypothetical protein
VVAEYVVVPRTLMDCIRIVTLAVNIFFADGTAFLITLSQRIKFVMAKHVPVQAVTSLVKHLNLVIQVYHHAGFVVRTLLMDFEFKKIKNLMPMLECSTTAAKEHISEPEQMICAIKESARDLISILPFEHIPRRLKIKFIYFFMLWLNAFLVRSGVSAVYSRCKLLVRWRMDHKKHCRVVPGTYCKLHNEPLPSNMMMVRMHEAVAVGPTGNLQGSVKFFCLKTGRILKWHSFMPIPMPNRVIHCVNAIRAREKQGHSFCFLNGLCEPYEWTDEVPEDDPKFQGLLDEEEAPDPDLSAELSRPELKSDEIDNAPMITEDDTHWLSRSWWCTLSIMPGSIPKAASKRRRTSPNEMRLQIQNLPLLMPMRTKLCMRSFLTCQMQVWPITCCTTG